MKNSIILLLLLISHTLTAQSRLVSWGMSDVEGLTEQVFNEARNIDANEWLEINKNATTWRDAFLAINNVVEHKDNTELLLQFADQITDTTTTKLQSTSRLIIWDRIISEDILFEGKGLVVENDLFIVAGRANQILQSALRKNFGYVSSNTDFSTLQSIKEKWIKTIEGEDIEEWQKPDLNYKNTIEEISNLKAFEAIVHSVRPNEQKELLTSNCLKNVYGLDAMPENPNSEAYCNPDTYSFAYLGMLVGEKPADKSKDYKYWKAFWDKNKNTLRWNNDKGHFVIE